MALKWIAPVNYNRLYRHSCNKPDSGRLVSCTWPPCP